VRIEIFEGLHVEVLPRLNGCSCTFDVTYCYYFNIVYRGYSTDFSTTKVRDFMTLTNHPNSSAKIPHDQLVTMMNAFRAATRLAPRVATRQSALLINKATVQGKRVINEKNKKILAQRKVATVRSRCSAVLFLRACVILCC
jgi:hypothetical protein